jgi:hypothetical protein
MAETRKRGKHRQGTCFRVQGSRLRRIHADMTGTVTSLTNQGIRSRQQCIHAQQKCKHTVSALPQAHCCCCSGHAWVRRRSTPTKNTLLSSMHHLTGDTLQAYCTLTGHTLIGQAYCQRYTARPPTAAAAAVDDTCPMNSFLGVTPINMPSSGRLRHTRQQKRRSTAQHSTQ